MKKMRSFSASTIEAIKGIHEHYNKDSILKELIQNADDAGATQLHIGLLHHLKENLHPLLCSPAIFILNNGSFLESDIEGIFRLRTGTKSSNHRSISIGKFGPGR